MHSDGQVGHDAQRHPGSQGLGLGAGQLVVELPLQPPVEVDRARMALGEVGDLGPGRVAQTRRPGPPVAAEFLGQRAPGGEVVQCGALATPVGAVRLLPAGRARHRMDQCEGRAFGGPRGVAVDDVALAGRRRAGLLALAHPAAPGHGGELRDRLDPQVQRADEASRGRQVGGGFHRCRRRGRVQGVDQHESGPVARPRPHRQVGQIGQVAHTPGTFRGEAVKLGGQTPGAPRAHPRGHAQPGRCDDQRGNALGVPGAQVHPVVAQRKVPRQYEGGLADTPSVEVERRGEVISLPNVGADAAVLQSHPDLRRGAVGDMNPQCGLGAGTGDDHRR